MNSQTNESSDNYGLSAEFFQHFSYELASVLKMFMTLGESLALWMLLLKQGSYLSYIKKVIKNIIGDFKLQTHILQFLRIDCKTYLIQ